MAKRDIRMTAEEVTAFLQPLSLATIVAGAPGEAPHAAMADFRCKDGDMTFTLGAHTQAARALAADGRVCCIVDQRPFETAQQSYYDTKAAMLHGHARPIEGAPTGKASFALTVEKVVSFDFEKLRA